MRCDIADKPTALIVEDDPRWQERYTKTLNRAGFKTVSALTVDEAKTQLNQQRFDLAIVDMNLTEGLPQFEGLEVLKEIRKRDDHTAIVVSTGYPTVELAVEGFQKYRINRFHQKREWTPDAFSALIDAVIRERSSFKPEYVFTDQLDFGKLAHTGTRMKPG